MENKEDNKEIKITSFDVRISGVITEKNFIQNINVNNVNISGDMTLGHFILLMKMMYEQSAKWANDSVTEKAKNDMRGYDDLLQEMYLMKMKDFVKYYLNEKDGNDKGE